MTYWLEYYYFASHYPTRVAAWLGTAMLLASLALIVFIFLSRKASQRKTQRIERLTDKYETLLTNILFEDTYASYSKGYDRIVRSITGKGLDKLKRETLVHTIIKAKENMMGESDQILTNFYHELKLRSYAMREMRTGKWYDKAFVIQELGKMDVKEALPTIMRYTDHPNPTLRAEAQYAAIDLAGGRALGFLDDLKYPLSRWQQIRITQELEKIDPKEIPSFYYLLENKNESVVVFAIELIGNFNQFEEAEKLLDMMTHPSSAVKVALADAFRALEYEDAVPHILANYVEYSTEVKAAMLAAVGQVGNEEAHLDFLFEALNTKDYRVALAAARAIYEISFGKITSDMLRRAGTRALYLKHVVDERKH